MSCKICGKETPEGIEICEECQANSAQNTEDVTTEVVDTPVEENITFNNDAIDTPEEVVLPAKKGGAKKGWMIALIAVLIVAIVAASSYAFCPFIKGLFLKTFGDDVEYAQFVEKRNLSATVENTGVIYSSLVDQINKGYSTSGKLEISVGDGLLNLVGGTGYDFLKNVSLEGVNNFDGEKLQAALKFNLGKTTLLDFDYIYNMAANKLYLAIPILSDTYLNVPQGSEEAVQPATSASAAILKKLPSAKLYEKIVNKYIGIAIDNIDTVKKDSTKVTVSECSQKLTVLEYKVDQKDLVRIANATLKELKKDADIKALLNDYEDIIVKELGENLPEEFTDGYVYEAFCSGIDSALESVNWVEATDEEVFTLLTYVNGTHEIVGREIVVDGASCFNYVTVKSGKNYGFELGSDCANISLIGKGTIKNDLITGDYKVVYNENEVFNFAVENFDTKSLEKGKLNGSVELFVPGQLIEELTGQEGIGSMFALATPSIKLTFKTTDTSYSGKLDFNVAGISYLAISASSELGDGKTVTLPADDKIVKFDSEEALFNWLDTVDVTKLANAIKSVGFPAEINSMVDQYVEAINQAGGVAEFVEYMMAEQNEADYDYAY